MFMYAGIHAHLRVRAVTVSNSYASRLMGALKIHTDVRYLIKKLNSSQ